MGDTRQKYIFLLSFSPDLISLPKIFLAVLTVVIEIQCFWTLFFTWEFYSNQTLASIAIAPFFLFSFLFHLLYAIMQSHILPDSLIAERKKEFVKLAHNIAFGAKWPDLVYHWIWQFIVLEKLTGLFILFRLNVTHLLWLFSAKKKNRNTLI